MAKARGLLLSRVGFPGSQEGSFTCAIAATSQRFPPPQALAFRKPCGSFSVLFVIACMVIASGK